MKRKSQRQHPELHDLFWCPKCQNYKNKIEFISKNIDVSDHIPGYCLKCGRKKSRDSYKPKKKRTGKCVVCGNEFQTHSGRKKYCSIKCKCKDRPHENRKYYMKRVNPKRIILKTCANCGKELEIIRGAYLNNKGPVRWKYCSKKCQTESRSTKSYDNICVVCKKLFISKGHIRKTCSKECTKLKLFGEKREILCPICKKKRFVYGEIISVSGKNVIMCPACSPKERGRKARLEIKDSYIVSDIKKRNQPITKETIELIRQRITMKRTLKQFKQWREENGYTDNRDVQAKQYKDEKNHERNVPTGRHIISTARV